MEYGTGAIFGCPAHDQRDLDFARKYDLDVLPVVVPKDTEDFTIGDEAYTGPGRLANSEFLDGLDVEAAKSEIANRIKAAGRAQMKRLRLGYFPTTLLGLPDPAVHCDDCGVVPLTAADLPVVLPDDVSPDRPGNPLDRHEAWKTGLPEMRKARHPRNRHLRYICGLVMVLRASPHPLMRPQTAMPLVTGCP